MSQSPLSVLAPALSDKERWALDHLLLQLGFPFRYDTRDSGAYVQLVVDDPRSFGADQCSVVTYRGDGQLTGSSLASFRTSEGSDAGKFVVIPRAAVHGVARELSQLREDTEISESPLLEPKVDQKATALREALLTRFPRLMDDFVPFWPNGAEFAGFLSHDIDVLHWGRLGNVARRVRLALEHRRTPARALKSLALGAEELAMAGLRSLQSDERLDLDLWLSIERDQKVKATYYFALPCIRDVDDPIYEPDDRVLFRGECRDVRDIIESILRQGAEVGLHSSLKSRSRENLLRSEKDRLDSLLPDGVKANGVRQHYLRISYPETMRVQSAAGFLYDSSVGCNRGIGLRSSTSFPYYPAPGREMNLLEIPFAIQDIIFDRKEMSGANCRAAHVDAVIEMIRDVKGIVGVNWHNFCLRERNFWRRREEYSALIERLKDENAWIATGEEICRHWRKRSARLRCS